MDNDEMPHGSKVNDRVWGRCRTCGWGRRYGQQSIL